MYIGIYVSRSNNYGTPCINLGIGQTLQQFLTAQDAETGKKESIFNEKALGLVSVHNQTKEDQFVPQSEVKMMKKKRISRLIHKWGCLVEMLPTAFYNDVVFAPFCLTAPNLEHESLLLTTENVLFLAQKSSFCKTRLYGFAHKRERKKRKRLLFLPLMHKNLKTCFFVPLGPAGNEMNFDFLRSFFNSERWQLSPMSFCSFNQLQFKLACLGSKAMSSHRPTSRADHR